MTDSQRFYEKISLLDDFTYLYYYLKLQLAPTRSCQKLGGLLNLSHTKKPLHKIFLNYRQDYEERLGLKSFILRESPQGVLVYFFQEKCLEDRLQEGDCQDYLRRWGYENPGSIKETLECLKSRFQGACPHEVGLFLGYPLSDVEAFTNFGGKASSYKGYWCVYSNIPLAKKLFSQYDQSKEEIIHRVLLEQG